MAYVTRVEIQQRVRCANVDIIPIERFHLRQQFEHHLITNVESAIGIGEGYRIKTGEQSVARHPLVGKAANLHVQVQTGNE